VKWIKLHLKFWCVMKSRIAKESNKLRKSNTEKVAVHNLGSTSKLIKKMSLINSTEQNRSKDLHHRNQTVSHLEWMKFQFLWVWIEKIYVYCLVEMLQLRSFGKANAICYNRKQAGISGYPAMSKNQINLVFRSTLPCPVLSD